MIEVYYNNIKHNVDQYDIKWNKLHRDGDLPAIITSDGSQYWYKNGQRHRDGDLPAQIWDDGTQYWYKNGQRHRDGDLPAEIWPEGTKFWYKNGQLHRDGDFPAIIWWNEPKEWWKNDKYYKNFNLTNLKSLQLLIRILYFFHKDKMKYSPKNLVGVFIKKQLYKYITSSKRFPKE